MSVDRDEVARIARLARLDFDESDAERMVDDLNRILEYAENLREVAGEPDAVESGGIAPHEGGMGGVRDEAADVTDALDVAPSNFAPDWRDGFFAVPPPPGVAAEDGEA